MNLCIFWLHEAFARVGDMGDTCDFRGGQAAGRIYVIVVCKTYATFCYSMVDASDHVQVDFLSGSFSRGACL